MELEVATWYYKGSIGQLGPLTLDQMQELVDGGVIEPDTYVWHHAMSGWSPASTVDEFRGALARRAPYLSPPPLPTAQAPVKTVPATYARPTGMNAQYAMISDKNRALAGVLNLVIPGAGRLYLGHSALGMLQLLFTFFSCGVLWVWSFIDGILILTGGVKVDGYGRILPE